jgi:hypothetical protein
MRTGNGGTITTIKDFHALVGMDAARPANSAPDTQHALRVVAVRAILSGF